MTTPGLCPRRQRAALAEARARCTPIRRHTGQLSLNSLREAWRTERVAAGCREAVRDRFEADEIRVGLVRDGRVVHGVWPSPSTCLLLLLATRTRRLLVLARDGLQPARFRPAHTSASTSTSPSIANGGSINESRGSMNFSRIAFALVGPARRDLARDNAHATLKMLEESPHWSPSDPPRERRRRRARRARRVRPRHRGDGPRRRRDVARQRAADRSPPPRRRRRPTTRPKPGSTARTRTSPVRPRSRASTRPSSRRGTPCTSTTRPRCRRATRRRTRRLTTRNPPRFRRPRRPSPRPSRRRTRRRQTPCQRARNRRLRRPRRHGNPRNVYTACACPMRALRGPFLRARGRSGAVPTCASARHGPELVELGHVSGRRARRAPAPRQPSPPDPRQHRARVYSESPASPRRARPLFSRRP